MSKHKLTGPVVNIYHLKKIIVISRRGAERQSAQRIFQEVSKNESWEEKTVSPDETVSPVAEKNKNRKSDTLLNSEPSAPSAPLRETSYSGTNDIVNNNPVIVTMNNICFATKIMSVFLSTLNLSGFFGVLLEIKKKMLNLRYNL